MITTAAGSARQNAPLRASTDIIAHLARFGLAIPDLLTVNPKTAKTGRAGIAHSVIHHALPADGLARAVNPRTIASTAPRGFLPDLHRLAVETGTLDAAARHHGCPWATAGCRQACLAHAGHGGLSRAVAAARGRRTLAMVADPAIYARAMVWAVAHALASAGRQGLPLAVRLNGTDESPWLRMLASLSRADCAALAHRFGVLVEPTDGANLPETFSAHADRIRWYEYLKGPVSVADGLHQWRAAGWDVTASFAADRLTACRDALVAHRCGFRLAVPVAIGKRQPLPCALVITSNTGERVRLDAVDGDLTDARWLDSPDCAVLLREKRARGADRSHADRFILRGDPVQKLADGTVELIWPA